MLKSALGILVIFLSFQFSVIFSQTGPSKKLVILHTNDMHSRLEGYGPSSEFTPGTTGDDSTVGGFSRIATILKNEKSKNPDITLIVDDGDFLMGTLFHHGEEISGFQLPLMRKMGYEVVSVGNHEFDYGPEVLSQIIRNSAERGEIPGLLLSNVVFDDNDPGDDSLEDLYNNDLIRRSTIINKGGLKIGFFALMGADADDVAPFAPPVTFSKQRKCARKISRELKSLGCDLVICLSHSGIEKDRKGRWKGEDVKLAKKVRDLDLIISGHTHSTLEKPLVIKGIPIVQAGDFGRFVGRLEMDISNGDAEIISYSLIKVDDSVKGDDDVQELISQRKKSINLDLLNPLEYNIADTIIKTSFELVCDEYGGDLENSNLGPLVADAIYNYVNSGIPGGTDVSMVATGVIRDRIIPGHQTVQDIFRVISLGSGDDNIPGYPLAQVYVTGIELKRIIEILLVAYKSSPSNYCYYAGLEVHFDPEKGLLRKIESIKVRNDSGDLVQIDLSKKNPELYSITANSYMLEFIGIIKKMTFGLVNVIPKSMDGNAITDMKKTIIDFDTGKSGIQEGKEWIALVEFLRAMKDNDGDGITDLDEYYLKPPYNIIPINKTD
jgi:5'-nucleotidase